MPTLNWRLVGWIGLTALALIGCGGGGGSDAGSEAGAVALNEVDCHGRDWVEIMNTSDGALNLGGWIITDSLTKTDHFYALPTGTALAAHARLVVKSAKDDEVGFSFGIKCESDTVYLLDANKKTLDKTAPGAVPSGSTWGRYPDGTGTWQVTLPTQGEANQLAASIPDELFTPTVVNTFAITLPDASVAALNASPYEYVEGTLNATAGSQTITNQKVGVRLKSGVSFQPLSGKAAFKIKATEYDSGARVFGLKNLTLNNMVDDPTMMHETLTYRIFRALGIQAPRTGYATVSVNGENYGLYVVIESYDGQFDDLHFETTGHLYEGTGDLYADSLSDFEVEDGAESDISDLQTLIRLVTTSESSAWLSKVSAAADMKEMTTFWAAEHYVGQSDGYSLAANNFFLHSTSAGAFTMLPWGLDRTLSESPAFGTCSATMCATCMGIADCKNLYTTALATLPAVVTQVDPAGMATQIETAISASVAADTRKPYTTAAHQTAVQALSGYFAARFAAATEASVR